MSSGADPSSAARAVGSPRSDPTAARLLRQLALHRETAALLEMRASMADSAPAAEALRRRAGQRRAEADRLWRELATGGFSALDAGRSGVDRPQARRGGAPHQ